MVPLMEKEEGGWCLWFSVLESAYRGIRAGSSELRTEQLCGRASSGGQSTLRPAASFEIKCCVSLQKSIWKNIPEVRE